VSPLYLLSRAILSSLSSSESLSSDVCYETEE
jgi:hypothetical protein